MRPPRAIAVLALSGAAAAVFAGGVAAMPRPLWGRDVLLFYQAPVVAAFTAFLLDRAEQRHVLRPGLWLVDATVVMLAAARALYPVPWISGHALFLTYAALTTRLTVARWLAIVVLAEVVVAKVFYLHDPTWVGGVVVGGLIGWGRALANRGTAALSPGA